MKTLTQVIIPGVLTLSLFAVTAAAITAMFAPPRTPLSRVSAVEEITVVAPRRSDRKKREFAQLSMIETTSPVPEEPQSPTIAK